MLRNIEAAGFPRIDKFLVAFSQCKDHDVVKTWNTFVKECEAEHALATLWKMVLKGMHLELDNAAEVHYLNTITLVMGPCIWKARLTQYCK
jgi:hypothetical protein